MFDAGLVVMRSVARVGRAIRLFRFYLASINEIQNKTISFSQGLTTQRRFALEMQLPSTVLLPQATSIETRMHLPLGTDS